MIKRALCDKNEVTVYFLEGFQDRNIGTKEDKNHGI